MAVLRIEAATALFFLVAALCLGTHPAVMLGVVCLLALGRLAAHAPSRRGAELALFSIGVLLGGLNDWISVDVVGLYRYEVPSLLPALTTVPEWMWLGWGFVLRLVLALATALGPAEAPRGFVRAARARMGIELVLVLVTRQAIYRLYEDPWLSWVPFALALGLYAAVLGLDRRERWLVLALGTVGPLAEVLLIEVGGVHHYALGWLGGVPLWIALWWVLGALVWKDVGAALERRLAAPQYLARRAESAGHERASASSAVG